MCKYAVFEPHAPTPEVWRCCMNKSTLHSIAHGTAVQIPSNWLHLKLIQSLNSMDYCCIVPIPVHTPPVERAGPWHDSVQCSIQFQQ